MQADMDIGPAAQPLEHAQATLNGTAVDDPYFAPPKLLQEMRFSRADTCQTRHLSNAAPIQLLRQVVRQTAGNRATGAGKH
jgi:hypothetical protein